MYVAAVGNLSLQGYPEIEQYDIIQCLDLPCTDIGLSLSNMFAMYHKAIFVIDSKTKG